MVDASFRVLCRYAMVWVDRGITRLRALRAQTRYGQFLNLVTLAVTGEVSACRWPHRRLPADWLLRCTTTC